MDDQKLFWLVAPVIFASGILTLLGVKHIVLTVAYFVLAVIFLMVFLAHRRQVMRQPGSRSRRTERN